MKIEIVVYCEKCYDNKKNMFRTMKVKQEANEGFLAVCPKCKNQVSFYITPKLK